MTVTLINEVQTGTDAIGNPIYEEVETEVSDVLVAPSTVDEVTSSTEMFGKKAIYTIAIPKGDQHNWENQLVRFFGHTWRVFGYPMEGIEANIPLRWHRKWMVEHYG